MKTLIRAAALILSAIMILSFISCEKPSSEKTNEYVFDDKAQFKAGRDPGHNRVFYEIFVSSFSDSNGDGIGDLRGIINRLDYLNDGNPDSGKSLGIGGIWLTPIFKSSSYHKYNVNDFYQVDPDFGTKEDLKELIAGCHERGILLILDMPINHTGTMNPWYNEFVIAQRKQDTSSEYYDFYTWHDDSEGPAPAGRTFQPIAGTTHSYECNFSGDMPELNYDNEAVFRAVVDVAKHYLELGIDGFRFDAAKYIYFGNNQKSTEFWVRYMEELRSMKPDVYAVGEVWDGDGITDIYMQAMNCFDFAISETSGLIAETAKKGNANIYTAYIESYLDRIHGIREGSTITPFITNHDMDRAAGFLTVASGYMKMAANLYILGPGTPFIYYGEEIGVRGSRGAAMTDANRRLKMPWGDGDTVKDPTGASYPAENRTETDVIAQLADPNSLYSYYKRLIMIRNAFPEIAMGDFKALRLNDTKVGGFTASLEGSTVIVLHNPSGSSQTIDLKSLGLEPEKLCAVIGIEDAVLDGTVLTIGGQTSVVLK